MKVQILGPGCSRCKALEERVRKLVAQHKLPVEVEKVSDIQVMIQYGIMATPGLVIDGVLKSAGSVPKDDLLLAWMKGTQA